MKNILLYDKGDVFMRKILLLIILFCIITLIPQTTFANNGTPQFRTTTVQGKATTYLIALSNDNTAVYIDTDDLRQAQIYLNYENSRTFSVRLYYLPKNDTGNKKMFTLATTFINNYEYTTDYLDKIRYYSIEGTFDLPNSTFTADKLLFMDESAYPIYWFDTFISIRLNSDYEAISNNIVEFYEWLKLNPDYFKEYDEKEQNTQPNKIIGDTPNSIFQPTSIPGVYITKKR